jgi:hypothetical protein
MLAAVIAVGISGAGIAAGMALTQSGAAHARTCLQTTTGFCLTGPEDPGKATDWPTYDPSQDPDPFPPGKNPGGDPQFPDWPTFDPGPSPKLPPWWPPLPDHN